MFMGVDMVGVVGVVRVGEGISLLSFLGGWVAGALVRPYKELSSLAL